MASSSVAGTSRGVLLAAGAGAIVALAGIYVAKKAGRYFRAKQKMRLIQNSLLLSTRCAWFISGMFNVYASASLFLVGPRSLDCVRLAYAYLVG